MTSTAPLPRIGTELVATVDLQRGAKIVSLRDHQGDEWLLPPRSLEAPSGTPFTDAEMGGWDECAPTIDACSGPLGRSLPDHGDVWDVAWDGTPERHWVRGRSLPYRLTRAITPIPAGLRFEYEVVAGSDMPFLWAAHPQFRAPPGTRVVADGVTTVIDVLDDARQPRPWPAGADSIDDVAPGRFRKLYADPSSPSGAAALVVPGRPLTLSLDWEATVVPYLGVWFDRGALAREPVVALEPSTGYFDSLRRAVADDRVLWLRAGAAVQWQVAVTVG